MLVPLVAVLLRECHQPVVFSNVTLVSPAQSRNAAPFDTWHAVGNYHTRKACHSSKSSVGDNASARCNTILANKFFRQTKKACLQPKTRPALSISDCCDTTSKVCGKRDTKNAVCIHILWNMKLCRNCSISQPNNFCKNSADIFYKKSAPLLRDARKVWVKIST